MAFFTYVAGNINTTITGTTKYGNEQDGWVYRSNSNTFDPNDFPGQRFIPGPDQSAGQPKIIAFPDSTASRTITQGNETINLGFKPAGSDLEFINSCEDISGFSYIGGDRQDFGQDPQLALDWLNLKGFYTDFTISSAAPGGNSQE